MRQASRTTEQWVSVRFPNNRGQQLAGLWLRAESRPDLTLVVCHGFTGSKESSGKTVSMAEHFAQSGISSLIFDFSGNGDSQGQFEDITLSGQLDDVSSAVDWCLQDSDASPVVLLGRSFGGSTAICQAARDHRVAAVCSWAAPADPLSLFSGFRVQDGTNPGYSLLSSDEGTVRVKNGFFDDLARHNVVQAAAQISPRPFLILHGGNDHVVPPQNAQTLYNAAGHPKELRTVSGADHRFSQTPSQVWHMTLSWLERIRPTLFSSNRSRPSADGLGSTTLS